MNQEEALNHKAGFVNIIGKPNTGKSTIMNALVGEKLAIATAKAQTTRHRIMGIVNGDDYQIVYSDTPGIIDPKYALQESMMKFVKSSLQDADVLLIMVEVKEKTVAPFWEKIEKIPAPKIFILNKVDLVTKELAVEHMAAWKEKVKADHYFAVSALHGHGLPELFSKIKELLPVHPPYFPKDELTDKSWRFFVSEIIREKVFLNYKQEIPYSVEIVVDSFKEDVDITRIKATIFVNRKSQKPIIIGKGGSLIKKLGIESRKDIEAFIGKKVYLELFVKIRENWRNNDSMLKNFGYKN